ncbi:MAG TPA: hypothetical protein VK013_15700 [Myxococcaceae bacterium]|nr:hypothetical protein [Myxococcaceae bacterium]
MTSFAKGIAAGLVVGHALVLVAALVILPFAHDKATSAWNLVTVTVIDKDIPAGTPLTYQLVAQRDVPEQFVTEAHVRPEQTATIISRPMPHALKKGEPLVYSSFALAGEVGGSDCE